MNTIIVIPARGGSKGVKNKNIKCLNGIPLIHYTINAARKVFNDADIYVSTDSNEIKKVSEQTGIKVPFIRPEYLATDVASTRDVLLHAIDFYEKERGFKPDRLILLQPTSPLRTARHIKDSLTLWRDNLDMVVSVKETSSNPYYVLFEEDEEAFLRKSKKGKFSRRQDCPKVWEYNGAIYIINVKRIKESLISDFDKVVKYVMDEYSSYDIDNQLDWDVCEMLVKRL